MRIVVIGGTGLVGSNLVHTLTEHGHDAVAAAPSTGVNAVTGQGLSDVLTGASVVVDEFLPTIADSATVDDTVRLPSALIQPMASADVAEAVAIAVVADPVNGITEVGGPEQFRLPHPIRTMLTAHGDTRPVLGCRHR
jgi:uncharacterized protein YbjT (DUF2867 family)